MSEIWEMMKRYCLGLAVVSSGMKMLFVGISTIFYFIQSVKRIWAVIFTHSTKTSILLVIKPLLS